MKLSNILLTCCFLYLAGCGPTIGTEADGGLPQQDTEDPLDLITVKTEDVEWDPAWVDGQLFFKDRRQFEGYVRNSDIVATGVLTDWDQKNGRVQSVTILQGEADSRNLSFVNTGGFVRAKVGHRVVILLLRVNGELRLHSTCPTSGLFPWSIDLEHVVRHAVKQGPVRRRLIPGSPDE